MKHLKWLLTAVATVVTTGYGAVMMDSEIIDGVAPNSHTRSTLQDIVTWDEDSIFIHGERMMLFSGEIHPFR